MKGAKANGASLGAEERAGWSRIAPIVVVAAIGLALSVGAFAATQAWERGHQAATFRDMAKERVEALRLAMGSGLEALQSLRAFLVSSREVTRSEFGAFTGSVLARHPEIQAFGWNPHVTRAERAAVEARARGEGFPNFRFTERNERGNLVPAAERDNHVVVLFLEPYAGNEAALGYDIASDPARRQSIVAARDSGGAAVTERITLVQETADQFGVLVLLPVYRPGARVETVEERRRHLEGFAVGVYRISDIVERSLASSPGPKDAFTVYVFDRSAPPGKQRLYPRRAEVEGAKQLEGEFLFARSIAFAGRDWLVAVLPADRALHSHKHWAAWGMLTAGLVFTVVLTAYLWTVLNQRARTEKTVLARTQELHETNRALRKNERALEKARSELERRVEDRTVALRKSNQELTREAADRQQAERALLLRERAIEASSNGILITDAHHADHPIVYVNPAFTEITAYPPEEALDRNAHFLQGEDRDQPALQELRDAIRESRVGTAVIRNYRKDGSLFWNEMRISPVRDAEGRVTHFVGVMNDVTEVIRREEALRESEARFRDYAEAASDWLWEMDEALRFTKLSGRFEELTGIDPDLVLGMTRWEVVGADVERSGDWRRHREDLEAHRPFRDFAYARVGKDGRLHHFKVNGKPLFGSDGAFHGYRGTERDVTAEVEAETARRVSEARLMDVVTHSPSAIFLKDLKGRFLLVNQRFEEWFGLTSEEVLGKTSHELFIGEFADRYVAQDREALESGRVTEREIDVPFADGTLHTVIITKFPVLGADGQAIGVGTIDTDITAHRQAEAQLRQAQKMEAVGQLTGGVAHDFNNLLAIVLGNLDLVDERLVPDGELKDMVQKAITAAERGASLTERLLAFSRKQALQPETVDVDALVQGMLELLRRSLGETIEVAVSGEPGLWPCSVDLRQLENALLNLAINARDAMPEGGRLTIESSNVRLDDEAAASAEVEPGDYVCLAVRDSGCGMSPELIEKAFDPFVTTKEVGKGSGLGLSMVYGFVRQSGGQVRIQSELGRGTTVRLYLPCAAGEAKIPERPSASGQAPEGLGERLLVVEDDADLRKLVVSILETLGYRVEACATAHEALQRLEATGPVDLLLTDVRLPGGLGGTQLAERAAERWPGLPILYMTGYAEDTVGQMARRDGEVPLLHKPFRKGEIARAVRKALGQTPA